MNYNSYDGNLSNIAKVIESFVKNGAISREIATETMYRLSTEAEQEPIYLW